LQQELLLFCIVCEGGVNSFEYSNSLFCLVIDYFDLLNNILVSSLSRGFPICLGHSAEIFRQA